MSDSLASVLVLALTSLAGWVWHKVRGDNKDTAADLARSFVNQALHALIVTAETRAEDLRDKVTSLVWDGLARAGIKRSAIAELAVSTAVEAGIAAALKEAKDHDRALQLATLDWQAKIKAGLPALEKTANDAIAESRRPIGGGE